MLVSSQICQTILLLRSHFLSIFSPLSFYVCVCVYLFIVVLSRFEMMEKVPFSFFFVVCLLPYIGLKDRKSRVSHQ